MPLKFSACHLPDSIQDWPVSQAEIGLPLIVVHDKVLSMIQSFKYGDTKALSKALHVPATRINDIVLERRGVTPDTALRLARYFGGDAESWLSLQQAYDLKTAATAVAKVIEREITPLSLAT